MLQYSPESMFWLCNRIAQFAYLRYNQIGAEVRQVVDSHEHARLAEIPLTDARAMDLWKRDPLEARRFLTDYSLRTASDLFKRWQELDIYLLVKYMDGNTKHQNPDGSFASLGSSPPPPRRLQPLERSRGQGYRRKAAGTLMRGSRSLTFYIITWPLLIELGKSFRKIGRGGESRCKSSLRNCLVFVYHQMGSPFKFNHINNIRRRKICYFF